jgi:hypothetical protein
MMALFQMTVAWTSSSPAAPPGVGLITVPVGAGALGTMTGSSECRLPDLIGVIMISSSSSSSMSESSTRLMTSTGGAGDAGVTGEKVLLLPTRGRFAGGSRLETSMPGHRARPAGGVHDPEREARPVRAREVVARGTGRARLLVDSRYSGERSPHPIPRFSGQTAPGK